MADRFGMMSKAYFKGKRELLYWIREFLQMDVSKVETLACGAHYCQLLDALYPGSIKMNKVNFGANYQEQYVRNWKLVQNAFVKQGIQKIIPVQRLIKCRFQDNLEFLQWFHQYFTSSYRGDDYNPTERRKKCKGHNQVKSCSSPRKCGRKKRLQSEHHSPGGGKELRKPKTNNENNCKINEIELLKEKNYLMEELERISTTAKAIESERDFYFQVLLKVETVCRESATQDHPDLKKIQTILYSSNEGTPQCNTPQKPELE